MEINPWKFGTSYEHLLEVTASIEYENDMDIFLLKSANTSNNLDPSVPC